jgi:Protein of unknown function (DUF2946)
MDEIVRQAMAKWPQVPHCYGWLALDARGNWRMRDERAQALGLPGETIRHPALLAFIQRNYGMDERGCWFFQNGPQRVFIDLAITPWIVHSDPNLGLVLQTGEVLGRINAVWLTDQARLLLESNGKLACMDDRDWLSCLDQLSYQTQPLTEDHLNNWLELAYQKGTPTPDLLWNGLTVQAICEHEIGRRFGFQSQPHA